MTNETVVHYAGFWRRLAATMIDSVLLALVMLPILFAIYGAEYFEGGAEIKSGWNLLLQIALPLLLTGWFWRRYLGTPGKVVLKVIVVDAGSGNAMTNGQAVGRYFAYLASALPLGLGFIWIAFDRKKRGLHDLMCGTLVIKRDEGNGVVLKSRVD